MQRFLLLLRGSRAVQLSLAAVLVVLGAAVWWAVRRPPAKTHGAGLAGGAAVQPVSHAMPAGPETIAFPRASWQAAGLKLQPVERGPFPLAVELTGKIALNEDRVAHLFPLVDGRVDDVRIHFGAQVKKGDLLVVVQSKEVGQAMLQLYQDRMQLEFALTKDAWTQSVVANTRAMIDLIRQGAQMEEIEKQLQDRPMGEYRDKLMSAYIDNYRSRRHLDRLSPLAKEGAVTGKQMLEAEADWNASRTTLQSLVEQLEQDARQQSITSTQMVKELQTRVAVDETNLKILGFSDAELAGIDPARQGETISHYPIHAPFDGTIISKDVVLFERVGPETQILSIADLSTVWVTADIYEEHLPLLPQLAGQRIRLRSGAWPGKVFEAQVFYTGDVVAESSRTISLRAVANNADGLLKPGMFVSVELPSLQVADVLQVPLAAVQDHEGKSFVFVHTGAESFVRRDVTLGRRNAEAVEIVAGLRRGEVIVTDGGFALKSRMLASLLEE